jgi:alcohol oxidase
MKILEAGPHTKDVPQHIQPARFLKNLTPNSSVLTFNVGRPSKALLGRAPVVSCARAVGGGSSINCRLSPVLQNQQPNTLQSWSTIGHPLLITTLGRLYTGTKDGVQTN